MSTSTPSPRRGDVWRVNLDPTIGAEIRKTRPVVVVSSDAVGILPIKLIAPIPEWDDRFWSKAWIVRIEASPRNGLTKTSAVDVLQLRGVDTSRFVQHLGVVSANILEEVVTAIAVITEYS